MRPILVFTAAIFFWAILLAFRESGVRMFWRAVGFFQSNDFVLRNFAKYRLLRKIKVEELEVNCRYDLSVEELIKANKFSDYIVDSNINNQQFPVEIRTAKKRKRLLFT